MRERIVTSIIALFFTIFFAWQGYKVHNTYPKIVLFVISIFALICFIGIIYPRTALAPEVK